MKKTIRRYRLQYVKLLAIFALAAGLLVFFYTMKLRSQIETNTLLTIEEAASHDRQAIQTSIDFFLAELAGVEKRLAIYGAESISGLENRLNLESATTSFSRIFMLSEKGNVYTDKFVTYNIEASDLADWYEFNDFISSTSQKSLVMRFDDRSDAVGPGRDYILYALKVDNFEVNKIKMKAILAFTDIKYLQQYMIIDSFVDDGSPNGVSFLIDSIGNYIVGGSKSVYLHNDANFFTKLSNSLYSTMTKREIQTKMREFKSFDFYMQDSEGEKLVYFTPFNDQINAQPDWYFIMIVDNNFLERRHEIFFLMSISLLGLVVLTFMVIMLYGISTHNKLLVAKEAVRMRSDFLSNMSHEIRTPLNGLIGLNYLISKNIDSRDRLPQIRSWLQKSAKLADYLLGLLNDILDMSRLQSGKIDVMEARFSIPSMLEDIIFMQSAAAETRGVKLSLRRKLIHPNVLGDEIHIKQILTNIIGNAIKFTKSGGSVTLTVSQEQLDESRVLTIYECQDTGIGMTPAFLEIIFDPFMQEASAQNESPLKGSGLGMPISKQLTEAMGGSINVRSELGKGSLFIVKIPSLIAPANSEDSHEDDAMEYPEAMKGAKILLAEDAEFNAEFFCELLTDEGFQVVVAKNGKEAVEIFRQSGAGEFQIILMDMQMPVMDGCEATQAIRAMDRPDAAEIIIYACTANAFREDMQRALESGMNDFLTKPIDIKAFLKKMRNRQKRQI